MRRSFAYLLCSALLAAFGQAPTYHIHREGHVEGHVSSEHRRGWITHAHVEGLPNGAHDEHRTTRVEASEDESGVVDLNWFQIERQAPVALVCSLATTVGLAGPDSPKLSISAERTRIHDPPLRSSPIPRAPPA